MHYPAAADSPQSAAAFFWAKLHLPIFKFFAETLLWEVSEGGVWPPKYPYFSITRAGRISSRRCFFEKIERNLAKIILLLAITEY